MSGRFGGPVPDHLVPQVSPEAAELFAGAARGELRIQRCRSCSKHQHYPRVLCSHCGAEGLEWVTASGRGTVHSFTVIRQHGVRPFSEWVPFVVALVDLEEEGARMLAVMPSVEPDEVTIGMPVVAEFRPATDEVAFVDFRPAGRD
ncbi:MAG: Zn-ribbon domain-containing OB-fold protein [Acidimicrobiia bacterium]|nr:Zn-ribbon domain-containing OB-fold protein [Acidimicrobiia bacterium]